MKISVVVPAFNEENIIAEMLDTYKDFLAKNFDEYELILVDDGSQDKTLEIARSCKDVICISYKNNRGKGYAVKRGFLRATGDYIFFADADLSFAPQNISRALNCMWSTHSDAVVGIRQSKDTDYTFFRRTASKIFAEIAKRVIDTPLADTQCGFKGFERSAAKQIFSRLRICDFGFDFEVIYLAQLLGKSVCTIPVSFNHRRATKIHFVRDGLGMMADLIRIKRDGANGNIQKTV